MTTKNELDPAAVKAALTKAHAALAALVPVVGTRRLREEFEKLEPVADIDANAWMQTIPSECIYQENTLPHGQMFQLIGEVYCGRNFAYASLEPKRRGIYRDHMGVFPGNLMAEAVAHTAGAGLICQMHPQLIKPQPIIKLSFAQPETFVKKPLTEDETPWVLTQTLQRKEGTSPSCHVFVLGCIVQPVEGVPAICATAACAAQLLDLGRPKREQHILI